MRRLRVLLVLGVVLVVSLAAGAYAAGRQAPPITAAQAREFTERAFTYAFNGTDVVEITGDPRPEDYRQGQELASPEGADPDALGDPIPVWVVPATVSNKPAALYVTRRGDRAVLLDDALPGSGFVLNEEQFARLGDFRLDLAGESASRQRQGPGVAAAVLLVIVGLLLVVVAVRARGSGSDRGPGQERPKDQGPKDQGPKDQGNDQDKTTDQDRGTPVPAGGAVPPPPGG